MECKQCSEAIGLGFDECPECDRIFPQKGKPRGGKILKFELHNLDNTVEGFEAPLSLPIEHAGILKRGDRWYAYSGFRGEGPVRFHEVARPLELPEGY